MVIIGGALTLEILMLRGLFVPWGSYLVFFCTAWIHFYGLESEDDWGWALVTVAYWRIRT